MKDGTAEVKWFNGWISRKQIGEVGMIHVYLDKQGKEVEVSEVTQRDGCPNMFDDSIFVGRVSSWQRNIQK